MRVSVALGVFVASLAVAATVAGATTKPATVRAGNLEVTFDGGFSPLALPENSRVPIALRVQGRIRSLSGLHVPALKEMLLKVDKDVAIDLRGYPPCEWSEQRLEPPTIAEVKSKCRKAIVGEGEIAVEIAFPESRAVPVDSDLVVLSGGASDDVMTLFLVTYITVPVPASVVTTVEIEDIRAGRYGTLWTFKVPKIAGGSGSIKSLRLTIDKKSTHKGERVSALTAKCPDGKLWVKARAFFADGSTPGPASISRTCTARS